MCRSRRAACRTIMAEISSEVGNGLRSNAGETFLMERGNRDLGRHARYGDYHCRLAVQSTSFASRAGTLRQARQLGAPLQDLGCLRPLSPTPTALYSACNGLPGRSSRQPVATVLASPASGVPAKPTARPARDPCRGEVSAYRCTRAFLRLRASGADPASPRPAGGMGL